MKYNERRSIEEEIEDEINNLLKLLNHHKTIMYQDFDLNWTTIRLPSISGDFDEKNDLLNYSRYLSGKILDISFDPKHEVGIIFSKTKQINNTVVGNILYFLAGVVAGATGYASLKGLSGFDSPKTDSTNPQEKGVEQKLSVDPNSKSGVVFTTISDEIAFDVSDISDFKKQELKNRLQKEIFSITISDDFKEIKSSLVLNSISTNEIDAKGDCFSIILIEADRTLSLNAHVSQRPSFLEVVNTLHKKNARYHFNCFLIKKNVFLKLSENFNARTTIA